MGLAKELWKAPRWLRPGWLDQRTPHELVAMFSTGDDSGRAPDALAQLTEENRARAARGLGPKVPRWLTHPPKKKPIPVRAPRAHPRGAQHGNARRNTS